MSLDLETRLKRFLASAPQNIHPIQVVQISHSAMPAVRTVWREPYAGQVMIDGVMVDVDAANMEIDLAGSEGHLDQRFTVRLGLIEQGSQDAFREALDLIPIDTPQKISLVYFEYLSDDLTYPQATVRLQVESISYVKGAANIVAVSPRLSVLRTGELFSPREIPMLRGFL